MTRRQEAEITPTRADLPTMIAEGCGQVVASRSFSSTGEGVLSASVVVDGLSGDVLPDDTEALSRTAILTLLAERLAAELDCEVVARRATDGQ